MYNNSEYIRGREETQEKYEQKVYNTASRVDELRISVMSDFADEEVDEELLLMLDDVFDDIKNIVLGIIGE